MTAAPEELADDIVALAGLLVIVLAGPDADSAIDGMHRVALEIGDKAKQLRQLLDDVRN
jgi:hypothetical protein